MNDVLSIEGLRKSFGRRAVLRDIGLRLPPGSVYGLLGRNGEGKTTLCRIVLGVIPADGGTVRYNGEAIGLGRSGYKREVAYIPEESFFYGRMRVGELLAFNASFYPRWNAAKASDLLRRFGLERGTRIRALSRGMKLKLGLVAALAAEPKLVVLDDPTSGLDVPTRRDVLDGIIGEIHETGTAVLFSSHLVHELEGIIDRLGILHGGRLVLEEEYDAVKQRSRLVRVSFDGDVPESLGLPGTLTSRREGRTWTLAVYPWEERFRGELGALSPRVLEIAPMSLEEIFIHQVA